MARVRRLSWWVPVACVVVAFGCADIIGLTGDYREEGSSGRSSGGSGGAAGAAGEGAQGGSVTGGRGGTRGGTSPTGGDAGESGNAGTGTGGEEPTGGSSGTPNGGSAGAGTGGGGRGGSAGGGRGGSAGAGTGGGGTGGATVGPPSCEGALSMCGPSDRKSSCCASHVVPAGEFHRGNDPLYPATVSAFRLDDYEVTVARFRKFYAAYDGYRPDAGDGKNPNNDDDEGWDDAWNALLPSDSSALRRELACDATYGTWTDDPGENEARPLNCLSWYVANAFCIWDGGRLPTEAEWNYAAAGGDEQRVYPWSDPPESEIIAERHASYYVDNDRECGGDGNDGCAVTDFIVPGSVPDGNGLFGQSDLAGNVYEWVQDLHAAYPNPCVDCANLTDGTKRTIRGGCFITYDAILRTDMRLEWEPAIVTPEHSGVGVRCARPE